MLVAPYYAQQRGSTATVDCFCCWGRGCDPGMRPRDVGSLLPSVSSNHSCDGTAYVDVEYRYRQVSVRTLNHSSDRWDLPPSVSLPFFPQPPCPCLSRRLSRRLSRHPEWEFSCLDLSRRLAQRVPGMRNRHHALTCWRGKGKGMGFEAHHSTCPYWEGRYPLIPGSLFVDGEASASERPSNPHGVVGLVESNLENCFVFGIVDGCLEARTSVGRVLDQRNG